MTSAIIEAIAGAQLDLENPWPGLDAYQESSHAFFSGRDSEVDELHRRIVDEPITVLFGRSGLGKTSLLKAGVFPTLRDKDLLPVFFRLQVRPGAAPLLEQVRLALFQELRAQEVEHPAPKDGEPLWNYLHRTGQEFWTRQNRLVRPVLVFDQFEEVFTLGRTIPDVVAAFREDIADLVENRIPASLARQLEDRSISDVGLDPQVMPYKVVLSLREDFLADLEEWRVTMPSLRRNRMRLLPMGREAAMQAVYNERTRHLVAEPLARTIVRFLSSGPAIAAGDTSAAAHAAATIEPALLSLFCRGANEHRKRNGNACFDEALIEGAKDTIVADFYRSSLADQPERVQRFIEEQLITESGFRNSYSVDDAVAKGSLTRGELDALVNRHLLRHEHHLGADRIELTHDLLTAAVAGGRDERRLAEREQRERLERRRLRKITNRFAAAALLFLGLAIMAWSARRSAGIERDLSRSRELAAFSTTNVGDDPELAVVLAREALHKADTAEARSAIVDAAQYAWPHMLLGPDELHGTPTAVVLSPDGSRLAVLTDGRTLRVWDVTLAQEPAAPWTHGELDGAWSLAFSPDQQLIAVGRTDSIDLFQAGPWRFDPELTALVSTRLGTAVFNRAIAFSPDGDWLASTQSNGGLALLHYRDGRLAPPVEAEDVAQFAVAAGGTRIVTVSEHPLAAKMLELRDGKWITTPQDLSGCMHTQSVSPGAAYFSATWKAGSCSFSTTTLSSSPDHGSSTSTNDIIWSAGGLANAGILPSEDVVVREPDGLRFRIKGAHPATSSDMSRFVSVSEAGRRIALIDEDGRVKVYFLADEKPFFSSFDKNALTVSPDGDWMAVLRGPSGGQRAALEVVALEGARTSALHGRTRFQLDAAPARIVAARDSVIAEFDTTPVSSLVLDVKTGRPRFPRVTGTAEPLGKRQELLLVRSGATSQVVRTRDGAPVAPWAQGKAGVESTPAKLLVSPHFEAIAVLSEGTPAEGKSRQNARGYVVHGENLEFAGDINGPPTARSLEAAGRRLTLADAGTTIVDESSRRDDVQLSPMSAFEIHSEAATAHDGNAGSSKAPKFALRRRISGTVIKRFANDSGHRLFSSGDRWLALWTPQGADLGKVEVFDLVEGRTFLTVSLRRNTVPIDVSFTAGNTMLRVDVAPEKERISSILVPLTNTTLGQFATWLVPRDLKGPERCMYGFGEAECLKSDPAAPVHAGHADKH